MLVCCATSSPPAPSPPARPQACITKKSGSGCTKRWVTAAAARIDCIPGLDGAPGTLTVNFTEAKVRPALQLPPIFAPLFALC